MTISRTLVSRTLAVALSLAGVSALPAQSVVTDPVGFTTLTVAAKPASIRGFTYLSVNMFRPTEYRSAIVSAASVGGFTVLTFPAGSFTANQFTGTSNAHFVEIAPTGVFGNGTGSGIFVDVTANDTSTITLAEDVTSMITNGTSAVKVRPHWTLGTLLGTTNPFGFLAGTASTGDNVLIINPATGGYTTYYYSSTNSRWQTGLSTIANDALLRPDAGLLVERKQNTAISITVVGEVKLGPAEVVVVGGGANGNYTIAPNPFPLSSVTLANSGLYTGNAATGVKSGSAGTADTVGIFNSGTGGFSTYYYSSANNRWQIGLSTDASNVVIPEGASVLIFRRAGNGSFSWFIPQPAMNL